ncbi:hypothetical protein PA598K_05372 [Paenibacillus sp. 598K]|nr:hypothetical protein PA598K_05372 [Paenibacillus sp. 598K]
MGLSAVSISYGTADMRLATAGLLWTSCSAARSRTQEVVKTKKKAGIMKAFHRQSLYNEYKEETEKGRVRHDLIRGVRLDCGVSNATARNGYGSSENKLEADVGAPTRAADGLSDPGVRRYDGGSRMG